MNTNVCFYPVFIFEFLLYFACQCVGFNKWGVSIHSDMHLDSQMVPNTTRA